MNNQEQEILNMLEYLALHYSYPNPVSKQRDKVFTIDYYISNTDLALKDKFPDRDCHSFTLDFNLKQIKVYSYHESYHNGNHYDCHDAILDWMYLSFGYDNLKRKVQETALKEVKHKAEIAMRDERVNSILAGKI